MSQKVRARNTLKSTSIKKVGGIKELKPLDPRKGFNGLSSLLDRGDKKKALEFGAIFQVLHAHKALLKLVGQDEPSGKINLSGRVMPSVGVCHPELFEEPGPQTEPVGRPVSVRTSPLRSKVRTKPVSYTHLTLPTKA